MISEVVFDRIEVRTGIEQLTPQHREVLMLRYWEEMTYSEIAQVIRVPVGTVRSRLHLARAALAQALKTNPTDFPLEKERA